MRSVEPMPGNPWPHDMLITIEDDGQALLDLLWVREARGLDVVGDDLPPLLVATPEPEAAPTRAQFAAWSAAWPDVWRACLAHAGQERDPSLLDRLHSSAPASHERDELLTRLVGPSWQDSFGDEAFTANHESWSRTLFEERISPLSLHRDPERECLEQLVPAWTAGLTKIIEIPCRGSFTCRVGAHALLVTAETRASSSRYAEALSSFA